MNETIQQLIRHQDAQLAIMQGALQQEVAVYTDAALAAREDLLVKASLIPNVIGSAEINVEAAAIAKQLNRLQLDAKQAAEELRKPLEARKKGIIKVENEFRDELLAEIARINRACGDFIEKEQQVVRDNETLKLKDLAEIERERLEATTKPGLTLEQVDGINEAFSRKAALVLMTKPLQPMEKADGQSAKWVWGEFEITDIIALYHFAPAAVKFEVLRTEIINRLPEPTPNAVYTKLPGVTAKAELKVQTNSRRKQPIAV